MPRTLISCSLVVALAMTGCSSKTTAASNGSGGAPGSDSCPRNGTVPANLRDVERDGEGLVSTTFGEYPARTPDWARAGAVFSALTTVWDKTKAACPDLPAADVQSMDTAVSNLKASIAAKAQKTAANAANAVGLAVPALFDYFHPDIPLEVVRMDATFRQIGLDAHFGDWTGEQADITSLAADWTNSKVTVANRTPTCHRVGGTQTIVGDIDQSVSNLQPVPAAKDAKTGEVESENGALEIDTLELLFDCPPDGMAPKTGLGASCRSAADCTAGEVCDSANKGGTCAPDPVNANVGSKCATTIDCGSDPRSACNTEAGDGFPGGYCGMEPCDDVNVCPPGATCVSRPHETPGCWRSCTTDADCRASEGYSCQLFPINPNPTTSDPAGFGPSAMACGFPCKDDLGCTSPLKCDAATGKCKP